MAIHCIQVHKETIEKIPNALPNRNSVDIEIYGMEGIPEADLREHERQKGTNMPFPTPSSMGPSSGIKMPPSSTTAAAAVAVATGMIPPAAVLNIPPPSGATYPMTNFMGIPPPYPPPGIVPPPSATGDQANPYVLPQTTYTAVPPPPSLIPPQQMIHTPPQIAGITSAKPLFPPPGSNGDASASSVVGSDFKPLSSSSNAAIISKPASTVASTGSTSKIVHPEEDISLEEIRARNFFTQNHKFHYNNIAGENR